MISILGRIQFGAWEFGQTKSGTGALAGNFIVSSSCAPRFTGFGGSVANKNTSVLGLIALGTFELGQVQLSIRANEHNKTGSFICNAVLAVSVFAFSPGNRFNCDSKVSASFTAVPIIHAEVDCKTSVSFKGTGTIIGSFRASAIAQASFVSSAINYPRFRVDIKTGVQFFVRNGQGPACYYDNGYIDPNTKIFNYVF